MIRAAFSSLAGAWIARSVERGHIPERLSVPLTLLATRLPPRVILVAAAGYGFYRLNLEARAARARDISPNPGSRRNARLPTTRLRSNHTGARQTSKKRANA